MDCAGYAVRRTGALSAGCLEEYNQGDSGWLGRSGGGEEVVGKPISRKPTLDGRTEPLLTPPELLDRLARLVTPPRQETRGPRWTRRGAADAGWE